ncbi:DNA-binding transcriptional activator of the SARP family [Lentzea xinjiangensis]|uniref:DNA-binding transcriptional activator of the SARP family n=1 Tax=Lentzea xinjiangensis TaxID=402600 RepID=A0A1H9RF88_9PSEU|nr:AfsR/SARP family transcriptional regulator [Lentzea xinjiangensis]SER71491.1 DNA-binding transcriptional activator of the SARP family [Lentzea xinjiangensis]
MRYRLLGPLQISRGGVELRPGGPRQRALLAALALHANETVSFEHLSEAVWESPPAAPESNIRTYVAALRKLVPDDVVTVPGGYRLAVPADEVDVAVFERLCAAGDEAVKRGDHRGAVGRYQEALALWRGPALDGLAVGARLEAELTLLQERRLTVAEQHARLAIELGQGERLIAELRRLTKQFPLREQLWLQLMNALHRANRPAEALQTFEEVRVLLAEELGTDPGSDLRELHERLLRGDEPRLALNTLPRDVADFTGRAAEMDRLIEAVTGRSAVVISAIDGMPGVGKTTLAVHLAHRLEYPDGQLFIDLHAHTAGRAPVEPTDALDVLLRALGLEDIPVGLDERAALWRAELSRRRLLVVLDNAASADQVRPLLPGVPGSLVLVTSRARLVELEGTSTLTLDVLSEAEALQLFATIVGDERGLAEEAREVVELCGRLPLAVRLAAGRLRSRPTWTTAHLATRLREGRLSELDAVFALSFGQLPAGHRRLFALLGLHHGTDFDVDQAAALGGLDLLVCDGVLEDLVDVHLLEATTLGRYRMHDLLRQYARSKVDAPREPLTRLLDHFLDTANQATRLMSPAARRYEVDITYRPASRLVLRDYDHAVEWLETERQTLVAAVALSLDGGWRTHTWQLARALTFFCMVRGHTRDWATINELALEAAADNPAALAITTKNYAMVFWQTAQYAKAIHHNERAIEMLRDQGDLQGVAGTLNNLSLVYRSMGRHAEAADLLEQAITVARELGDRHLESQAMSNVSNIYSALGRYDEALRACTSALALMRELGSRRDEADTRSALGMILHAMGRHEEALAALRSALAAVRAIGDVTTETVVLNYLGEVLTAAGRPAEAVVLLREALELAERIDDRREAANAHKHLARAVADPAEAERHRREAEERFAALGAG